jgi:hypothetical protein
VTAASNTTAVAISSPAVLTPMSANPFTTAAMRTPPSPAVKAESVEAGYRHPPAELKARTIPARHRVRSG